MSGKEDTCVWKSRNLRLKNHLFALESQSCVTGAQFCLGPFLCCLYDGAEATETTATDEATIGAAAGTRASFVRSIVRGWISYLRRARFPRFPGMDGRWRMRGQWAVHSPPYPRRMPLHVGRFTLRPAINDFITALMPK